MIVKIGLIADRLEIVIHFGINPVRGGSPPNDRRSIGTIICRDGDWSIILFIDGLNISVFMWKIIKRGVIIREYIIK